MKKNYKYKTINGLESAIYAIQYDLIKEKYGEKAANNANYGWGVGGSDESTSIATKVYGHGVLQTDGAIGDSLNTVTHTWSKH